MTQSPPPKTPSSPPGSAVDVWLGICLFGPAILFFWPLTHWMVQETLQRDQIQHAFLVFIAIGTLLLWRQGLLSRHLRPRLTPAVAAVLGVSFLVLAAGFRWQAETAVVLAYLGTVTAFFLYLFKAANWMKWAPILIAWAAFLILVMVFPTLDWPLRQLAGQFSLKALSLAGIGGELRLWMDQDPKLLLLTGHRVYEVATECNGFGLMSGSLLLGLLLGLSTRSPWWWKLAYLPAAVFIGFTGNIIRIIIIVLLAPFFPNHYGILHETAGIVAMYGGLAFIYLLASRHLTFSGPDTAISRSSL